MQVTYFLDTLSACNSQQFMQSIIIKLHENTDETWDAHRHLFLLIVTTREIAFILRKTSLKLKNKNAFLNVEKLHIMNFVQGGRKYSYVTQLQHIAE